MMSASLDHDGEMTSMNNKELAKYILSKYSCLRYQAPASNEVLKYMRDAHEKYIDDLIIVFDELMETVSIPSYDSSNVDFELQELNLQIRERQMERDSIIKSLVELDEEEEEGDITEKEKEAPYKNTPLKEVEPVSNLNKELFIKDLREFILCQSSECVFFKQDPRVEIAFKLIRLLNGDKMEQGLLNNQEIELCRLPDLNEIITKYSSLFNQLIADVDNSPAVKNI